MAKQLINLGSSLNDGTGDPLRTGAQKINANFSELYSALTSDGNTPVSLVNNILAGRGLIASNPSGQVTVSANVASTTQFGVIKLGTGLNINQDGVVTAQVYTLPTATNNTLGGIRVGDNLTIDNFGTLSAIATPYTLPTASSNTLGGIKIGTGLTINQSGVVSVSLGTASALVKNNALVDLLDSDLDATLKASGSLDLLVGDSGIVPDNNLRLTWALDIDDVVGSKNSQVLIGNSGVSLVVTDESQNLRFLNVNHAGTVTLPETTEFASWLLGYPGRYPLLIAGFNDGENGGPELNWANNASAQDPFDLTVTRNALWINSSGVVFALDANSQSPISWQFKPNKETVFPGELTITGDPTNIIDQIENLQSYILSRQSLIGPLQAQLALVENQIIYWTGIFNQGPSNPLFTQSQVQLSMLTSQKNSLEGQISTYQNQIASAEQFIDGYEAQLEVIVVKLSADPVTDALMISSGVISSPNNILITGKNQPMSAVGGNVTIQAGSSQLGSGGTVYIKGCTIYSNQISDQGNVEILGGDVNAGSTISAGDIVVRAGKSGGSTPSGSVYISGGPGKNQTVGSNGGDVSITGGYRYGAGPEGFDSPGDSEHGNVRIGEFYTKLVRIGGNSNNFVTIATGDNHGSVGYNPDHVWSFDLQGRMKFPTTGVVPVTSKGTSGDTAGMIVIDASYIYYCTATYTNGIADIWKRTPHAAGTW